MKNLCFFIAISFMLSSCGKEGVTSSFDSRKKKIMPQLTISKFSLKATNAGNTEWIFWAQEASVYDEKDLVQAENIEIDFFFNQKDKTISSHLVAQEGNVNTMTNNMEARGNVIITAENGNKLFTEKIRWNSSSQKFFTDDRVKLEKQDSILTGVGMEADPNLDNIKILQEVKVEAKE